MFIGGGLSDARVFETAWAALKPGGRLVANAVSLASEAKLIELFGRHGGELVRLGDSVIRADLIAQAEREVLPAATSFGKIVGASPEMRRLYPLCERLAASSVPVIIEGETGTGKEVLAESLH